MSKFKTILEWTNVIASMLLIASMLFPFSYQKPFVIAFAISMLADIIVNRRFSLRKHTWQYAVFFVLIAYYACVWIWHIFEESTMEIFLLDTQRRLPFLIFGILGLTTTVNPRLHPRHFAYAMLTTGVVAGFWTAYNTLAHLHQVGAAIDIVSYQDTFARVRYTYVASHMTFNLYLNMGIVWAIYTIDHSTSKWERCLLGVEIAVAYLFLLTSDGRTGFITSILLAGYVACMLIYRYCRKYLVLGSIAALVFSAALLMFHPRMMLAGEDLKNGDRGHIDPRGAIWDYTLDVCLERPLLGYGVSDGRKYFTEHANLDPDMMESYVTHFSTDNPHFKSIYEIHPHNAWLAAWLEFGIVGVLLFSAIFVVPIATLRGEKLVYLTPILGIFAMQSMFESLGMFLSPMIISWFIYYTIRSPQIKG